MILGRKKKYTIFCISATIPIVFLLASTNFAVSLGPSGTSDDNGNTVTAVGGERLQINRAVSADFRFSPGAIHVRPGETIVLKDSTTDIHTATFVEASALPSTFNGVLFCGAPAIISPGFVGSPACVSGPGAPPGYPFGLHITPSFPPPWLPLPASCLPGPICNQFVDGGVASNTNTLGIDTAWSFNPDGSIKTSGDSVLILPGQTITMTISSSVPVGTVLHFMCIIHPWMQGEIIVDGAGD